MPRTRDLLARFRPAGTPGAAAGRGVPADRPAELDAEVGPVLDLLADAMGEASRIRADARQEADRRRRAGRERAQRIEADARLHAEEARGAAAADVTRRVAGDTDAVRAAAERRAAEVRRVTEERMPQYTDRVLEQLRADLAEQS